MPRASGAAVGVGGAWSLDREHHAVASVGKHAGSLGEGGEDGADVGARAAGQTGGGDRGHDGLEILAIIVLRETQIKV